MTTLLRFFCAILLVGRIFGSNIAREVLNGIKEEAEHVKNGIHDTLEDANDFVQHEINSILQDSALAGNILPVIQRFFITPEKAKLIMSKTAEVTDWEDLVFICFLGWALTPLIKYSMEKIVPRGDEKRKKDFNDTAAFFIVDTLSQVARLALLVYAADMVKIFLMCVGFTFPYVTELPRTFAKIIYSLWVVQRISRWKSKWVSSMVGGAQYDRLGRAKVINRLLDAGLLGITLVFLFEILSVQLGFAGKSIFAIGSLSTLVLSLASQGLASQVLNGLLLASSDRIYEGDSVWFGNGISGTVVKMGWMETVLRGPDEILLSIPNADLASERISNLSRIQKCQVKQSLRFQYDDADIMPLVVEDIKREIRLACPELITDGSRPFRVHFTSYGDDHLEVIVDTHFNIKPVGDEYWQNRQNVLMAIRRAVKTHQLSFAIDD